MITFLEQRRKYLFGFISMLRNERFAQDLGERSDGPVPCDLCTNRRVEVFRLLVSCYGVGFRLHGDYVRFCPSLAVDPEEATYRICLPCYRLLRSDSRKLVARILGQHDPEKN
jgi:hypothetical protein